MDTFPGQVADSLSSNTPLVNAFPFNIAGNLAPTQVAAGGLLAAPGNIFNTAAISNSALANGFSSGQTLTQISAAATAAGAVFAPPGFTTVGPIKAPTYQEWNFEVQQAIGNNTSVSINYVGNHGIHETAFFNNMNSFCPAAPPYPGAGYCPNGFIVMPAIQPDPRFGTVTQIETAAVSNYNGLSFTAQHRFRGGLQFQVNYTWSHALDEVSNGGFNGFISSNSGIGRVGSLLNPINDNYIRQYNYGNADYDTRHYVSMNYVYELPKGPTLFLKGWQLSGTLFARSGLPYTVVNGDASGALSGYGYGASVFANYAGPASTPVCSSPSSVSSGPCLSSSLFPDIATGAASQLIAGTENQRRNQFYGPRYFDTDMTVMKYTQIPRWETAKIGLGVQFFNLFNHPNFQGPVNDIASSNFGKVLDTVNTPTSILGSFLGGDASPRLIQLTVKMNF